MNYSEKRKQQAQTTSEIVMVLSLIMLVSGAAFFAGTNDQDYLIMMTVAALGMLAGITGASQK